MKKKFEIQNSKLRAFVFIFILFTVNCSLFAVSEAKVYIDVNSPAFKKLPIAISDFSGTYGREMSEIIKDDLEFTGLFLCIDRQAYLEVPSQNFNPKNWTPLGAEAVVKGFVKEEQGIVVRASLFDVFEGREIFTKEYKADKKLLRPVSHAIANDIYLELTGQKGIFRTKISFIINGENERSINIMDWDGHRIIHTGLKGNIILSPRWSRNGRKLLYSAERNRQWGIYLLDFTNMTERKVFSSKGTNIAGDFLPGGSEFVFSSSRDGTHDLYIMNLSNNSIKKLTSSFGIEVSPSVSPDGKSIAFVSDRGGSPQIYVMHKDGSRLRRITYEGSYNTSPSWSPKGDKIVFSGRRGKNQIFIINPDGSGLTQLTSHGNNEEPSFSPDGMYITFTSDRDGVKGIYIMRANGEAQRRITPKSIKAYGSRWSPD